MSARERMIEANQRFDVAKRNVALAQMELDRAREDLSAACAEAIEASFVAEAPAKPAPYEGKIAEDMLSGVREIAAFIGKSERAVYVLAEKRHIPTFKLGGKVHARKSELLAAMQGGAR